MKWLPRTSDVRPTMKWLAIFALISSLAFCCNSQASPDEPKYYLDIKPLFVTYCSNCHNQNWPAKNWLDYDTAYRNRDTIKLRVSNFTMPPGRDKMSAVDQKLLLLWISDGAPP